MKVDTAHLRHELKIILEQTAGAERVAPPAYWVGDRAGERRVADDARAGRLHWRAARNYARIGLAALDGAERAKAALRAAIDTEDIEAISRAVDALEQDHGLEVADAALGQASECLKQALLTRIEPADIETLSTSAQRRDGKPSTLERDQRIVAAIEATGLRGTKAIKAARKADPQLFPRDLTAGAVKKAIERIKKKRQ